MDDRQNQKPDEAFFNWLNQEEEDSHEKDEDFFDLLNQEEEVNHEKDEAFFDRLDKDENNLPDDSKDKGSKDPGDFFTGILMTRKEALEKVKKDGMFLKNLSSFADDFEVVSYAVEQNANALEFASKRIQSDDEAAAFFVATKNLQIEEARKQENLDLVVYLQDEMKRINSIHEKAKNDLQKTNTHNQFISM